MSYTLERVNNQVVRAIPQTGGGETRPILGADLFPEPYANIFLCAKKKSGKTSTVYHILKNCVGKNTKIYIFCSTVFKDKSYRTIIDYFTKKNIEVNFYTSLYEDGEDVLQNLIVGMENEAEEEEDSESDDDDSGRGLPRHIASYLFPKKKKKPKPKKPKYLAPEYIFIFDDLSTELKSKTLVQLLKKNRHFLCKIIISSQYYHDLDPQSRKQLDYFIIFKGQPEAKLELIHKDADIPIEFDEFMKIYNIATAEPYSFLYINTRDDEFRKNFSQRINI